MLVFLTSERCNESLDVLIVFILVRTVTVVVIFALFFAQWIGMDRESCCSTEKVAPTHHRITDITRKGARRLISLLISVNMRPRAPAHVIASYVFCTVKI